MLPQRDDGVVELVDRVLRSFGDKFFSSSPQDVAAATDKWCIFYSDNKLTRFGLFSALQKRDCSLVYVVGVMDDDAAAFAAAKGWEYGGAIKTTPEMNRVMNSMRPKLHKIKVDQKDALMVSCFPGYAWTHHVAKMVKTSFPMYRENGKEESFVVKQIFEVDKLRKCKVWDDLMNHFGAGGLVGKRVVIGYVDEVAKQFQPVGESAHWRDSPGGFYRTLNVLQGSKYPVVLLGVRHTFWGDIAGVLACKLYQLGAFEIVHVAKSGSLEHQDFQLRFITQDGFLPYYEQWQEKNAVTINVSNEASKVLERRNIVRNRYHTSFFSPLDEDNSSRLKVLNQATSVDIEVSFLASAIAECNEYGGRQMRFSCIHWISDYLWREKELSLVMFLRENFDQEFLKEYFGNQVDLVSHDNENLKRRAAEFCAFLAKEYLRPEVLSRNQEFVCNRVVSATAIVDTNWKVIPKGWEIFISNEILSLAHFEGLVLLTVFGEGIRSRRAALLRCRSFLSDVFIFLDNIDEKSEKLRLRNCSDVELPETFMDVIEESSNESVAAAAAREESMRFAGPPKFFSVSGSSRLLKEFIQELSLNTSPSKKIFPEPYDMTLIFDLNTEHGKVLAYKSALDQKFGKSGLAFHSSSLYVVRMSKALAWYYLLAQKSENLLHFQINKVEVFPGSLTESQVELFEQVKQGELTALEATLRDTLEYLRRHKNESSSFREPLCCLLSGVFDLRKLRIDKDTSLFDVLGRDRIVGPFWRVTLMERSMLDWASLSKFREKLESVLSGKRAKVEPAWEKVLENCGKEIEARCREKGLLRSRDFVKAAPSVLNNVGLGDTLLRSLRKSGKPPVGLPLREVNFAHDNLPFHSVDVTEDLGVHVGIFFEKFLFKNQVSLKACARTPDEGFVIVGCWDFMWPSFCKAMQWNLETQLGKDSLESKLSPVLFRERSKKLNILRVPPGKDVCMMFGMYVRALAVSWSHIQVLRVEDSIKDPRSYFNVSGLCNMVDRVEFKGSTVVLGEVQGILGAITDKFAIGAVVTHESTQNWKASVMHYKEARVIFLESRLGFNGDEACNLGEALFGFLKCEELVHIATTFEGPFDPKCISGSLMQKNHSHGVPEESWFNFASKTYGKAFYPCYFSFGSFSDASVKVAEYQTFIEESAKTLLEHLKVVRRRKTVVRAVAYDDTQNLLSSPLEC